MFANAETIWIYHASMYCFYLGFLENMVFLIFKFKTNSQVCQFLIRNIKVELKARENEPPEKSSNPLLSPQETLFSGVGEWWRDRKARNVTGRKPLRKET